MICLKKMTILLAATIAVAGQTVGQEWTSDHGFQFASGDGRQAMEYPNGTTWSGCQSQCHASTCQESASCGSTCHGSSCTFGGSLLCGKLATCPPPSFAQPFAASVQNAVNHQVQNGVAAQLVFYDYDFYLNPATYTWELSNLGIQHFEKIVRLMQCSGCPVIVQTTNNVSSDDLRQQIIIERMLSRGVAISPDRVVIGRPRVPGISGAEAQLIYARSLERDQLGQVFDTNNLGAFSGLGNSNSFGNNNSGLSR